VRERTRKQNIMANNWRNRIVGSGLEDPNKIMGHPDNHREHPFKQEKALRAILDEYGWVGEIILNKTTGRLLDGHLRVKLAVQNQEDTIPVKYVELSEHEEKAVLAVYDAITGEARPDPERYAKLLEDINASNPDLQEYLSEIAMQVNDIQIDAPNLDSLFGSEPPETDNSSSGTGTLKVKLSEKLKIPLSSVIDTRTAYWQARKQAWLSVGVPEHDEDDPVLYELLYNWFLPRSLDESKMIKFEVLDLFFQSLVPGAVAGLLGVNCTAYTSTVEESQTYAELWDTISQNVLQNNELRNTFRLDDSTPVPSVIEVPNTAQPKYDLVLSFLGSNVVNSSLFKNVLEFTAWGGITVFKTPSVYVLKDLVDFCTKSNKITIHTQAVLLKNPVDADTNARAKKSSPKPARPYVLPADHEYILITQTLS
jgi:hypothetical protein